MTIAKVTSKGQVTIPVDIRRDYGIHEGTNLDFIPDGDGVFRVVCKKRSIMEFEGYFDYNGPSFTIEEMDEALGDAVVNDYLRSVGELDQDDRD